jgi:hypothetical protein
MISLPIWLIVTIIYLILSVIIWKNSEGDWDLFTPLFWFGLTFLFIIYWIIQILFWTGVFKLGI